MTSLLWLPPLVPAVLAFAAALAPSSRFARLAPGLGALVGLGCGAGLAVDLLRGSAPLTAVAGLLRADELTAYLLLLVGGGSLAALGSGRSTARRWSPVLKSSFLASAALAVTTDNLGVMWVAIEATTVATAFLVGHHPGPRPLEAAWRYVVIGSVGIAIAFLGVVVLYAAASDAGVRSLSWQELATHAHLLDRQVTLLAVVLACLGFATKAGLAPMHAWLPDAYSQAPTTAAALMSGVLSSVALYLILRLRVIADGATGPETFRILLLTLGLISLFAGAALTLTQREYRRLLAYSSIEHMGLMAVGVAIGGPLATAAVLAHMVGHGLTKAALFLQAGRIQRATGTREIAGVKHLLVRSPGLAQPWLIGMAALAGFPPFPLFFTELAIIVAGCQAGLAPVLILVLVLLLIAFTGLTRQALAMTLGAPPSQTPALRSDRTDRLRVWLTLGTVAALPLTWPIVAPLLRGAAATLGVTP